MPDHRPDPKLRWHTETVTRAPIFVVPGDSSSSSSLKPMGKTWGMRVSGDVDKMVPHEYCCPVHGRFTLRVKASEVPDEAFCTATTLVGVAAGFGTVAPREQRCGLTSPWAGSSCAIGIEPGMVTG